MKHQQVITQTMQKTSEKKYQIRWTNTDEILPHEYNLMNFYKIKSSNSYCSMEHKSTVIQLLDQ